MFKLKHSIFTMKDSISWTYIAFLKAVHNKKIIAHRIGHITK